MPDLTECFVVLPESHQARGEIVDEGVGVRSVHIPQDLRGLAGQRAGEEAVAGS
ncbi:MAG TPA: hypothetical protein VES90_03425 [Candidatus Eisenbacteria bacterium]|nr:hypothetical protein [Candidatus Eisenbacteria bacterium]